MAKGRPTDNPKSLRLSVRATKDDLEKLEYCCKELHKTQYEIIIPYINDMYNRLKKERTEQA